MTTAPKVLSLERRTANASNAQRSTGPRTLAGKARSSANATKHGMTAAAVVLPYFETADEWEAHRDGVVEGLRAQGGLEAVLAERVAVLLWRLRRVGRGEREMIAVAQDRAEDAVEKRRRQTRELAALDPHASVMDFDELGPNGPAVVMEQAREVEGWALAVAEFADLPGEALLGADVACRTLTAAEVVTDTTLSDVATPSIDAAMGADAEWTEWEGQWTVAMVREAVESLAGGAGRDIREVWARMLDRAMYDRDQARRQVVRVETALRHHRATALLGAAETDRIMRYEAHLSRELRAAMLELREVQALRFDADTVGVPAY